MAFTVALYLRLSVDDDNRDESNSIDAQRFMLNSYVNANPSLSAGEILTFVDDGWSGTNFERPQVKVLLDLARRGGVQCIIVKDLSRWGRNYPEVSEYLDKIFPFLGIRFISLGEDYDSDNHKWQTAPLDVAFGTIMHDIYCRELSDKVRQSYISKTKNGEFLCGSPPFGFVKSSSGNNRLEVDSDAAETVRRIFRMAFEGNTNTQIAIALNNDAVDTPLMYRKRKGRTLRGAHSVAGERVFWTRETVRKILIDERYTGVMVSSKQRVSRPGSRKIDYLPKSEWIRIPGSHEAIVSEEIFMKVNAKMRHCKAASPVKKRSLFTGKVKCGCCGKSMDYAPSKKPYYYCEGAKVNSGMGCFDGKLNLSKLSEVVLTTVKVEALKVFDTLHQRKMKSIKEINKKDITADLKKLSARRAFLEQHGISLFEDFTNGKSDKDAYLLAAETNDDELIKIQSRIDDLNNQLTVEKNSVVKNASDESGLQRVLNAETITDEILSLIDRIIIFNDECIDIRFAFRDTN